MTNGALVLAGGGVAGIAWELGVLIGIRDARPEIAAQILDDSTLLIGTSAGAAVAAQLAGGTPLDDLYARQLSEQHSEISADINLAEMGALFASVAASASSSEDRRRRWGALAMSADTPPLADRRASVDARLPVKEWTNRALLITTVDAETGELLVIDRASGINLVDAVTASCAIPGIWPVVEINGHKYMDGGMRTISNADLAAGSDPVVILVPSLQVSPLGQAITDEELLALAPARVSVVYADDASIAAFGPNPLDPSVRGAAAEAGRAVGQSVAATIADNWIAD
jgi:NTE family protein